MKERDMRTIKFRCWDMWGNVMHDWEWMVDCGLGNIFANSGPKGKYIIQQFTGLLDRNGKEIYEGDVVKTTAKSWTDEGVVSLECGAFRVGGKHLLYHHADLHEVEIIGHIHGGEDGY